MAIKIKFGKYPHDDIIQWFVDHIGPRTHHIHNKIGGRGWKFEFESPDLPVGHGWPEWYLTVDDEHEKTLTYYLLMR